MIKTIYRISGKTYSFLSFLATKADFEFPPKADENEAYLFIPPPTLLDPRLFPLLLISGNFTSLILCFIAFKIIMFEYYSNIK